MENSFLLVRNSFVYAMNAFFSHPGFFILAMLAFVGTILGAIIGFIAIAFIPVGLAQSTFLSTLIVIFFGLFVALLIGKLYFGLWKLLLSFYDNKNKPVPLSTIFKVSNKRQLGRLFGFLILSSLFYGMMDIFFSSLFSVRTLSVLILIMGIPCTYFAVRFIFGILSILDKNTSVIQGFKHSYALTKDNVFPVFLVVIATWFAHRLASLLSNGFVGGNIPLFITAFFILCALMIIPITHLMIVYAYRVFGNE